MSRDYHVYAFDGIKINDFFTEEEARECMRNNPGSRGWYRDCRHRYKERKL